MKAMTSYRLVGVALGFVTVSCGPSGDDGEEIETTAAALTSDQLPTYGGGAILDPEIDAVYWGNFTSTEVAGWTTYLAHLVDYMSGANPPPASGKEPVLFQYNVYGASVGANVCAPSIPSGGHASLNDFQAKLTALQGSNGGGVDCTTGQAKTLNPYNSERLMVVFTRGITIDDMVANRACGDHDDFAPGQYFARVPEPKDAFASCNDSTITSAWQKTVSHEIIETATDPIPYSGWDARSLTHGEIGDVCPSGNLVSGGRVQNAANKLEATCGVYGRQRLSQITVTHYGSEIDVFGLGTDRAVWHWNSVSGWESLGGVAVGRPAAVTRGGCPGCTLGPKVLDVMVMSTDGAYYRKTWSASGGWWPSQTGWENDGGKFIGPPALASWGPDRFDVFGKSMATGEYLHAAWTDSVGWIPATTWEHLDGVFIGPPAVVSWGPNRLDVFGQGTDGAYYTKACGNGNCVNSGWAPSQTAWAKLGGIFIGPPTASSWGVNNLNVVGQGQDGGYHVFGFNGVQWALAPIGGVFVGPPAMVSWGSDRVDVFGQGTDFAYYHRALVVGQGWLPPNGTWEQHAMSTGFIAAPAIVSTASNRLDVFGEQPDGANTIRRESWNGSVWQSWQSIGGTIH